MLNVNALKRCRRLAEAVNDCCACSVFNYIPVLHGRVTHAAVAGKWHAARETQKFRLNSTSSIFKPLDWLLANFSSRFPHRFRNSPALILTEMLIWNEKDRVKYGDFPDQSESFCFFARVANYARHQNKLRHHWTGLAAKLSRETIKTSTSRLM